MLVNIELRERISAHAVMRELQCNNIADRAWQSIKQHAHTLCKHVESVSHQVENRLNSMLTAQIRLPNTRTVADPDSLENEACLRHQSVNPENRHCNSASAKGMVAHEICPKPSQNASCWQSRERGLGQIRLSHNTV